MKQYLLATVSTLAMVVAASAADMPARSFPTKAAPADPILTWTGAYIGLNAGVAWHTAKYDVIDVIPIETTGSFTKAGATFGGQIGYNWQQRNYVYGIEADLNWLDARGSTAAPFGFTFDSKLTWLGTLRARAGVLIAPPTLVYLTGGLAVGGVQNDTLLNGGYSDHSTRVGWTGGGGVEHKLTQRWSAKAEALYVDLGSKTVQGATGPGYSGKFTNTAVISRLGVNYKW